MTIPLSVSRGLHFFLVSTLLAGVAIVYTSPEIIIGELVYMTTPLLRIGAITQNEVQRHYHQINYYHHMCIHACVQY